MNVAKQLSALSHIAISSGAGISAESGVPTFREAQTGLWSQYDPQQLATPQAFRRNPDMVWAWYMHRHSLITQVDPNPGHHAVAALEDLFDEVTVITQNIDGLHAEAGSTDVIELHGNIRRFKCFDNCEGQPTYVTVNEPDSAHAPTCPHCDAARVRPDVVWFGEQLPLDALNRAIREAERCDALLVIGTSGLVQPAASLPGVAKRHGALIIEVNPNETPISRLADVTLRGPSGELLPQLVTAIREER